MQPLNPRFWVGIAGLGLGLLLTLLLGLQTGSFDFSWAEILTLLGDRSHPQALIIWDLRLPRLLLAFGTGIVLSLGGFFMQALIKNPLADPYIMGLTAGAGFGVNLVVLGLVPALSAAAWSYPIFAALGGLGSLALVLALGWRSLFEDSARLLIAGVAVSSIFTAATGVLIYTLAESDQVRQLVFWSFGSFGRARWEAVQVASMLALGSLIFGWVYARRLDLLLLGDASAQSLGMRVPRAKLLLLLMASVTVGGTVAYTGPIGFVGMMVPHFSRAIWGGNHRRNLLPGALLGGTYLMACDILGRWILPPAGLPIGIVTAILGVPFFLYLLFRRESQF